MIWISINNVDNNERRLFWKNRLPLAIVIVVSLFSSTRAFLHNNIPQRNNILQITVDNTNHINNHLEVQYNNRRRFQYTSRFITTTTTTSSRLDITKSTSSESDSIVISKIRCGIRLSQDAKYNVTAAEEACSIWEEVLSSSSSSLSSCITPGIISLSTTLYASCLVRIGRDSDAIYVYDSCLENYNDNNKDRQSLQQQQQQQIIKWRLSKARCHQRLLQYSTATEVYVSTINDGVNYNDYDYDEKARIGAATCIMRSSGNITRALDILSSTTRITNTSRLDTQLLSYCLNYIKTGKANQTVDQLNNTLYTVVDTMDYGIDSTNAPMSSSSSSIFLFYRWILAGIRKKQNKTSKGGYSPVKRTYSQKESQQHFMELIRINTSLLDDPDLLRLDDKIELHNLLSNPITGMLSSSSSYWPEGFVLPTQFSELEDRLPKNQQECNNKIESRHNINSLLWISKSRSGYGSHGNRILTGAEASEKGCEDDDGVRMSTNFTTDHTEPYLLQRMVDPLLLLKGYKFSLRIYVVYFSTNEVYISSEGLVKLASLPLLLKNENNDEEEGINSRNAAMHMTNSGRETFMQQHDLNYLWRELMEMNDCCSSSDLWADICNVAADTLLVRFPEFQKQQSEAIPLEQKEKEAKKIRREELCIPKILGLDFVVDDTNLKPWLVEINRFPGLEPRDEMDHQIKFRVVRDAWKKASERLMLVEEDHAYFNDIFESLSYDGHGSSLQRL